MAFVVTDCLVYGIMDPVPEIVGIPAGGKLVKVRFRSNKLASAFVKFEDGGLCQYNLKWQTAGGIIFPGAPIEIGRCIGHNFRPVLR